MNLQIANYDKGKLKSLPLSFIRIFYRRFDHLKLKILVFCRYSTCFTGFL